MKYVIGYVILVSISMVILALHLESDRSITPHLSYTPQLQEEYLGIWIKDTAPELQYLLTVSKDGDLELRKSSHVTLTITKEAQSYLSSHGQRLDITSKNIKSILKDQ